MKIYTKSGDDGTTGLYGGGRIHKSDPRIELIGEIDELNSAIGIARSYGKSSVLDSKFAQVQNWLFDLGSHVATTTPTDKLPAPVGDKQARELESWIDEQTDALPELREFILPGGTPFAAAIHLARSICRRAERRAVAYVGPSGASNEAVIFLNRLSDWMFVSARTANSEAATPDTTWTKGT